MRNEKGEMKKFKVGIEDNFLPAIFDFIAFYGKLAEAIICKTLNSGSLFQISLWSYFSQADLQTSLYQFSDHHR